MCPCRLHPILRLSSSLQHKYARILLSLCPMGRNDQAKAGRRAPWVSHNKYQRAWLTGLSLPRYVSFPLGCLDPSSFFQVDGELWDLERPLEKSCKLELLDFEHPEGLAPLHHVANLLMIAFHHREKGFLALFSSRPRRSCGEALRMSSMSWPPYGRRILLRDGNRG